ncbi:SNARE associated Golgi protein [Paraliobacillus sp. PM-2]|uniref:TVP38/TMEM64 family protein n=1 Tax=Paraliobacillus sp. PM-2 TaxID=1462524 RepID=UPI00061C6F99|nr:VTT domain-containing protein [Paraliobacillus sp. PM-2]CQR47976.1 SNARE associated Golgi protein [Paraliobacillus sp. PM-2]
MEQVNQSIEAFIDYAGWYAPLLFVVLHIIRPILFIPVIVVCIAGGVVFGFVEGAILSLIGLSLMSLLTYKVVYKFPKLRQSIARLKKKIFQDRMISVSQVMVLRIMPFVHFHLLSFYLMEMTNNLKGYMYYSILGLIAPAVIYTAFGEAITAFPWYVTICFFFILVLIYYFIDRRNKVRMQLN